MLLYSNPGVELSVLRGARRDRQGARLTSVFSIHVVLIAKIFHLKACNHDKLLFMNRLTNLILCINQINCLAGK